MEQCGLEPPAKEADIIQKGWGRWQQRNEKDQERENVGNKDMKRS